LLATPALAQTAWPDRPMRMLVGFPPGGLTDIVARSIAQGMAEQLGHPVVVENRPGAAGNLATEATVRSAPDGLTMLMAYCGQVTINPHTYGNLAFDPLRELASVTRAVRTDVALVVHPDFPARNLQEFLAYLRSQPRGAVNYATAGSGSLLHVVAELLQRRTNTEISLSTWAVKLIRERGSTFRSLALASNARSAFGASPRELSTCADR
jgi:tripartite-type tricarboxylate transporter receptor subunit TctC